MWISCILYQPSLHPLGLNGIFLFRFVPQTHDIPWPICLGLLPHISWFLSTSAKLIPGINMCNMDQHGTYSMKYITNIHQPKNLGSMIKPYQTSKTPQLMSQLTLCGANTNPPETKRRRGPKRRLKRPHGSCNVRHLVDVRWLQSSIIPGWEGFTHRYSMIQQTNQHFYGSLV